MNNYQSSSACKKKQNYQTGDVIFVKGNSGLTSAIIRFLSGSSFTHTAILIELRGLWFVIETRNSSEYGYQLVPLEWWMLRHSNEQIFYCKMPERNLKNTLRIKEILMDSMESLRPYKMSWILLIYLLQVCLKIFRPNLNKLYKKSTPLMCSTLIQEAWERAGIIEKTNYMTPGCLVKYLGGEKSLTLLTSPISPKSKIYNLEEKHEGLGIIAA